VTKPISGEDDTGANKEQQSEEKEAQGKKRAFPAVAMALMKNPKVQEAVIEKGIEVAGKLVDKQLKIIDEAQEKAEQFLKKEIKLDIVPDKSWITDSLYVPPGYHFQSSITDEEPQSSKESPEVPYVYPAGIGSVMMNGCYGKNYSDTDPCYNSRARSTVCWNQIDGAAFLGVGFDGRGKYSPESRKMSIVQRNCKNKATYDDFDVPDTMNVHGIYDTSAAMYTFERREEYTSFLQEEAGVSGSIFGFYAGVREAWGSSSAQTRNSYMALLDVNIERYEIFMDEVKPSDLSLNFLREFMELPLSYYSPGAPIKYQDFVQRWGTHYIKSAKFGGQLEIRKTMDKTTAQSKTHFSKVMEAEFKSLFASFGTKSSSEGGSSASKSAETTSTSVVAQGGSHEIASILSDVYSPTFKNEFKHWLTSIPSYPKPFNFRMSPITDLVNFRASDLFPEETVHWGCEGYVTALKTEKNEDGEEVKYYEITEGDKLKQKVYCPYDSRGGLEDAIKRRRSSLHRAIEVYMEEGTISVSDFNLQCPESASGSGSEPAVVDAQGDDFFSVKDVPKWKLLTTTKKPFKVIIDMKEDLRDSHHGDVVIPKTMVRRIRFFDNRWFTSNDRKVFHLYNGFDNGGSGNPKNKKISVLGLVLSFEEKTGSLVLTNSDFEESKKIFPALHSSMKGSIIGRVEVDLKETVKLPSKLADVPAPVIKTCKVMFSNALRFDPTGGKCLHFTAITTGTIYVMFAVSPGKPTSWYTIRIATDRIDIYKGSKSEKNTADENAVGLGEASIHQSFFVCVTESDRGALIEYGKSQGSSDEGDVHLSFTDSAKGNSKPLNVRFYAFGIEDAPVKIMDAHLLSRELTRTACKGETWEDPPTGLCTQECHSACDPLAGCNGPLNTECNRCRLASENGKCLDHCPQGTFLTSEDLCHETFEINGMGTQMHFTLATNMPDMSAFTASLWVKSIDVSDESEIPNLFSLSRLSESLSMNLVFRKDREGVILGIFVTDAETTGPVLESTVDFRVEELDYAENSAWHFICVTWLGSNGVVTLHVDGEQKERKIATNSLVIESFSRGGSLSFHVIGPISVTSFNMWDEELNFGVIAEHAKSCDGAIGDVVEWSNFWSKVESQSSTHTTPSTCLSTASPPQESGEGSTEDDFHSHNGKSFC